ncbi:MAG: trypsin-like peptidase domain-containing protein [Deltaproteobacteria bacterium]|nr:trypsin-like peptidase domain-containing protein [Deltaproteobacteria bacterium]
MSKSLKGKFSSLLKGTSALGLLLTAIVSMPQNGFAASMHPLVIYGADNRLEVFEELDASRRDLARSVVAIMSVNSLRATGPTINQITGSKYGESNNLCKTEKFYDQLAPAYCSGFLVADNIIATAGHCVQDADFCKDARFVFDFSIDSKGRDPHTVKIDDTYGCKKVLHEEMDGNGADFALVELDRPVVGRTPVRFANAAPKVGDSVVVIGHPVGLPAKIAGGAKVRRNSTGFFVANLDTYGGNSGSAVFNVTTNEVAGVLVRGETDFIKRGSCNVSYQCKDELCRGEDVTNPDIVAAKLLDIQTTP